MTPEQLENALHIAKKAQDMGSTLFALDAVYYRDTLRSIAQQAFDMLDYIEQLEVEYFTHSAERYALTQWGKRGRQYEPCYFCCQYNGVISECSKYKNSETAESSCFELRGTQGGGEE